MFDRIVYIGDQGAQIKLKDKEHLAMNLMNLHLVIEDENKKILAEVDDLQDDIVKVRFLGEIVNGKLVGGVLRKPKIDASIRVIEQNEIPMIVGRDEAGYMLLGVSPFYNDHPVYLDVNNFFSNHFAIFGNSGSGKSCGISRIMQNMFMDKRLFPYKANILIFDASGEYYNAFKDLNRIDKPIKSIEWGAASAEKDGYEDFMLKEINEQPNAIRETIGAKLDNGHIEIEDLNFTKEYLESLNKIYIVACGTAMHAGLVAKAIFERLCKIPVEVDIASEFRYRDPIVNDKTLAIYISQSGETADTIAALKLAKSKGAKTLAISNVIGSSITREADHSIYTHAGPEIAVASTKAYTSQVVLLNILGLYFAEKLEVAHLEEIKELKKDILRLPSQVEEILKNLEEVKAFAKKVYKEKDMFFLGRGTDYAVSLEGSLKLKEISYIHSEAYASGELKHGPIALIENGITVVATMTDKKLVEKSISNVQEVVTRGAKVLLITSENIKNDGFDTTIKIPKTNPFISPILSVIPMQALSYYISKEKGLDVDKPRNLAKSVTVE